MPGGRHWAPDRRLRTVTDLLRSCVSLVTGGAGYIGSHVVRHLLWSGYGVVVVDAKIPEPGVLPRDVAFVQASVTDVPLLSQTLRDHAASGVMHLAAREAVPESIGTHCTITARTSTVCSGFWRR